MTDSLNAAHELTVVVAPAGYGKTTLLSAWLATCNCTSAWLTLDQYDNDLATFTFYLVEALRTIFPGAADRTQSAVTGANLPSVEVLSRLLVSDLSAIEQPFILVLDDLHAIREVAIQQLVSELVRLAPESLRLVIASRHDPPLPLAKQRASGRIVELRASDLRFTADEAATYLRDVMALDLDTPAAARLTSQTEGWPVGLYLAGLYLRHRSGERADSTQVSGDNRYVMDYLVNEVLAQLPDSIQEFLIRTSILDELCQPLCEAVIGAPALTPDGQSILEWLEQNGIFVLPADEQGRWYRCHYLFRQMLSNRFERGTRVIDVAAYHSRASAWYEANGFLDEALRHALKVSEEAGVRIVADHRLELMNHTEWHRLERWLQLFPDAVVQDQPELLLSLTWLKSIRHQSADVSRLLDRVEVLLARTNAPAGDPLRAELAARQCTLYFWRGDFTRAVEVGGIALDQLPAQWWYLRGSVRLFLAVSYLCMGEREQSERMVMLPDEPDPHEDYVALMTGTQVFLRWAEADLTGIGHAASYVVSRELRFPESELVTSCHFFLGFYYYQRNDWEKAAELLIPQVSFPYAHHAAGVVDSAVVLVRIRLLQGRPDEAHQIVNTIMDFAQDMHSVPLIAAAEALQAELALRQGRLAEAGQWATRFNGFHPMPYPFPFIPAIEAATILQEMDTPSSRQQARTLLDHVLTYFTSIGYTSVRLQVLALQALLASKEGDEVRALGLLEESVQLAEPGWFLRIYPDFGTGLRPLLMRLHDKGVSPSYVSEILASFNGSAAPLPETSFPPAVPPRVLLTYREQEVLQLLVERRSDKQIAEALVISIETVRSHIYHLATKLGVHGRRAIVQAAQDLHLLD
ncbi:MAG: LuxR C-terminal-related transcriptional regulator [Anaerolineae bacterium]